MADLMHEHHGRGSGGELAAPLAKRVASPSPIRIDPTSRPSTVSVPQRRAWLQLSSRDSRSSSATMSPCRKLRPSGLEHRCQLVSASTYSPMIVSLSATAKRSIAARWASMPRQKALPSLGGDSKICDGAVD
jgi:hypothetical protein